MNQTSGSGVSFWLYLASATGINALLLWFFHNRFWYATDEGNYAHVAERILQGDVLNLNVQDIHAGYINFVNAAAFRLFGLDLVSLRYPLIAVAFVQAVLIFLLFYREGRKTLAIPAAVAINALGVIQFLNPTSNWYSLFVVVLIICCLQWIPTTVKSRLPIVGFLIGTLFLFRQLSGVFVCMSVLTYLFIENRSVHTNTRTGNPIVARVVIAIMAAGLTAYLIRITDVAGFVLFGLCPLLILLGLFARTTSNNRQTLTMLGSVAIGGVVACLPLLSYHLIHGSLQSWLNDTVLSAVNLTRLSFMGQQLYLQFMYVGFQQLGRVPTIGELLNALYWITLHLLAFANGILVLGSLSHTWKSTGGEVATTAPLPIVAAFYGIVSVHFQIPIYVHYSACLSIIGIMWLMASRRRGQYAAMSLSLVLSGIAVFYHAGQPLVGTFPAFFSGRRNIMSLNQPLSSLPRVSLKIDAEDEKRYAEILKVIESHTRLDDTIFALPTSAELYFITGRRNPFRFYNSALGIRTESDFRQVRETIIAKPPKLVLYRPDDKYNTDYSRELMRVVEERYEFLGETSGFAVYGVRQNPAE